MYGERDSTVARFEKMRSKKRNPSSSMISIRKKTATSSGDGREAREAEKLALKVNEEKYTIMNK